MDWSYESWKSGEPYSWGGAARGDTVWDSTDYHVDLGCGTVKKGRIGIDRYAAPGVNIVMDLDTLAVHALAPRPNADAVELVEGKLRFHSPDRPPSAGDPWLDYPTSDADLFDISHGMRKLPFDDSSIESIISHHALEHIGEGFIPLMDEIYRVLKPDGLFYGITPLFPSYSAVQDPDHCRYFMVGTFDSFCGHLGDENNPTGSWLDSFSVPYTKARFLKVHEDHTGPVPVEHQWTPHDVRELRVALKAVK